MSVSEDIRKQINSLVGDLVEVGLSQDQNFVLERKSSEPGVGIGHCKV